MKCSVCSSEITGNYCSRCGQKFVLENVGFKSIIKDLMDSLFSIEGSFYSNLKMGMINPGRLVRNYWKGFRSYYYSPAKLLTIAALFISINFLLGYKYIFITVMDNGLAPQFVFLGVFILFFTLGSAASYYTYKKNFFDHLIMNIYIVSTWTILFFPVSILVNYFEMNLLSQISLYTYMILISIGCSQCFELSFLKRAFHALLQLIVVGALIYIV